MLEKSPGWRWILDNMSHYQVYKWDNLSWARSGSENGGVIALRHYHICIGMTFAVYYAVK